MPEYTTIRVSESVAEKLHDRKSRGETYDDVLRQLLNLEPENTTTTTRSREHGDTRGLTSEEREAIGSSLAGSGEVLKRRIDAIESMYQELQLRGTAEKNDLLSAIDPDQVEYVNNGSVWANMVKGKDTLATLSGVQKPPTGRSEWKYTDS